MSDDNPLLTRLDFTLKKVMLLLAIDQKTPTIGADIVAGHALTLYPYLRQTYGLVDRRLNAGSQFNHCRARLPEATRTGVQAPDGPRDRAESSCDRFPRQMQNNAVKTLVQYGDIEEIVQSTARGPKRTASSQSRIRSRPYPPDDR